MLAQVLTSKAAELEQWMGTAPLDSQQMKTRVQEMVRVESVSMMMEEAVAAFQQASVAMSPAPDQSQSQEIERAIYMAGALRRYISQEVGGEYAQELAELCQSAEEMVRRALKEQRLMPLQMAENIMLQVKLIWQQGLEQVLMDYLAEHTMQQHQPDPAYAYYHASSESPATTLGLH